MPTFEIVTGALDQPARHCLAKQIGIAAADAGQPVDPVKVVFINPRVGHRCPHGTSTILASPAPAGGSKITTEVCAEHLHARTRHQQYVTTASERSVLSVRSPGQDVTASSVQGQSTGLGVSPLRLDLSVHRRFPIAMVHDVPIYQRTR